MIKRLPTATHNLYTFIAIILGLSVTVTACNAKEKGKFVQDAEYYILEAQNSKKWTAEDKALDKKLAELRKKHGRPPNIIHIMWDDTAFGDVGIPAIQKVRGLETPNLNKMAEEGILFTRMYTEVGCTPSRAASATGRLAIRSGMYNIGMLLESHGMRGEEVTIAEVLSKAGYATASPYAYSATNPIKWRLQTYSGAPLGAHVILPQIEAFNKAAHGRMEIELYYADQLVATDELFRAMQNGTIDAVQSDDATMASPVDISVFGGY
ncbi:MAG: sulfatase-like hydrolase/transferase, partial [Desulfobacterales bacterium]